MLNADVEVDRRDFTVRAAVAVAPGQRLALFGPSGAGKTTLLETIAGLVHPTAGTVELAGRVLSRTSKPRVAVPPWQRRVGLLRQDPGLFPHLSVRDNLCYARTAGTSPAELADVADALGIGGLLPAMPARLSGGQQHRAALGRLLLAHCDALLLDEPYSGLDAGLRRTLSALVVRLVTERQIPAILVAHELADAQSFATQLAILDHGRVLQVGTPNGVVLRPACIRVAELVGYLGFAPVPGRPGVLAGVHPDRVIAGRVPERGLVLAGQLAAVRPAGAGWEADLRLSLSPGTAGSVPDLAGSVPGPAGSAVGVVTCRLPEFPGPGGSELAVTAIDPPLFGAGGLALAPESASEPAAGFSPAAAAATAATAAPADRCGAGTSTEGAGR